MPERQQATWGELLRDAVEKPGRMLEAYAAFHNYSILCVPQHRNENVNRRTMSIEGRDSRQTNGFAAKGQHSTTMVLQRSI